MARRIAASLFLLICCASLAAAQLKPLRVRVSESYMQSLLTKKVEPVYPGDARIQGTVVLRVVISKAGDVENIQLISGHPMLAPAAIDAVRQWKYQPYLMSGQAVDVETTVRVKFMLPDKPTGKGTAEAPTEQPGGGFKRFTFLLAANEQGCPSPE